MMATLTHKTWRTSNFLAFLFNNWNTVMKIRIQKIYSFLERTFYDG